MDGALSASASEPGTPSPSELAHSLAESHAPLERAPTLAPPFADYGEIGRVLSKSARAFRSGKEGEISQQKAGEWVLDNLYICERALRQVKEELPVGFRRRLPHVEVRAEGDSRPGGEPRILLLARELIRHSKVEMSQDSLLAFVHDYQERAPLTVAELWALPNVLRLAVLEYLACSLRALFKQSDGKDRRKDLVTDPALGVERCIRALRLFAEIGWKAFFESSSVVQQILSTDPAKVYARSEFETCDECRKVVEEVAWTLHMPEPDVASKAIALAEKHPEDPRLGHVGYYLIGKGREELDAALGYRPPLAGERMARSLRKHPTASYFGVLGGLSLVLCIAMWAALIPVLGLMVASIATVLAIIPITSVATVYAHRFFTRVLRPRTLPKLDLADGIPAELRTAVVIPALIAKPEDVDDLLGQLEVHYLSHPEPSLAFVLLVDHVDATEQPDDAALLKHAETKVETLNRAHGKDGKGPFHVLYRTSLWNPAEDRFMGWERKRGKLWEWNKLLRGEKHGFTHHFGDTDGLTGIRYVITLDADTHLPLGAARRLVGLMAHPLNHAVFDEKTGRVTSGYTVIQPRVEVSPLGGVRTFFARVRAGDTAIDIYTNAVSDVYQDLFGAGIYVGKGIYDVDAFMQSLDGRVPENALASHDLFEGSHGRAGLATDIVLFEEYPHHFLAFVRRQHRWIRGDWQLVPWLFSRVPAEEPGEMRPNVLAGIDRFKIADNLRRSLFAPSLLVLVTVGLFVLPSHLAFIAVLPLLAPLALLVFNIRGGGLRESLGRYALYLLSLPHEAWTVTDAVARVAYRSFTKKHRLEWVTAAHTARSLKKGDGPALFYGEMAVSVVATVLVFVATLAVSHGAALAFAPFALLWIAAPDLLRRASTIPPKPVGEELTAADRRRLGRLARRTWYFFESFVGPGDQWLPPDNFQAYPRAIIAHRTSPTNIGLLLTAEISAHDFGYIGPKELSLLLTQTFGGLMRLERYAGHWLNWYGTKDLAPLLPRYVSTVDSGNLCAALIALATGCEDVVKAPILGKQRREGLRDTLGVLEEALGRIVTSNAGLDAAFRNMAPAVTAVDGESVRDALQELIEIRVPELSDAIVSSLGVDRANIAVMKEARVWLERLDKQARSMRADYDVFLAFTKHSTPNSDLSQVSLVDVMERAKTLLESSATHTDEARTSLEAALRLATELTTEIRTIGARARAEACAMDYRFLYDPKRRLFHTGYNVTSARLDPSYYDLMASEARVASFVAIMMQQVPVRHWFALGRPVTRTESGVALLSWGATMFEYLLPDVFMRSQPGTLLAESARIAVDTQIKYGQECGTPWGISESSFAQLDAQDNYQYRSFGVPGLGLKRGLEEDLVIAPYASMLGVGIRPRAVMDNLTALTELGAMGIHGLFEAIDYRSPGTEKSLEDREGAPAQTIVRSHMAHHQGMILAALNNALHGDPLIERFHADPLVHTAELLLSERVPSTDVAEDAAVSSPERPEPQVANIPSYPAWNPSTTAHNPELLLLTNGRLTSVLSDAGSGDMRWRGLSITAPYVDATRDVQGTWIYVRDLDSGSVWSATAAPTRPGLPGDQVSFAAHRSETHERQHGISVRTEVVVAQLHDAEIRHVTIHNESDVVRKLSLSSYLEPVLEPAAAHTRHPAFSRMFVECDVLHDLHGVACERRKKSPEDAAAALVHRVVWESEHVCFSAVGTDRRAFIGRRHTARSPAMSQIADRLAPLDPAVSVSVDVTIAPGATVEVAWVTAVSDGRDNALEIAKRFGSMHAVRWVVRDAERECARRLHEAALSPELLPMAAKLWSRLIAPAPFYGGSAHARRTLSPTQPELWGHGLSGDFPLLVLHVDDPAATPLATEVLAVYRYLRAAGVMVELVFLDANPSGYQADQAGNVRAFLIAEGAAGWLHQRGGVFVLAKDRLGPEETQRIEAASQVLLHASRGGLAAQWTDLPALPAPLPLLTRTRTPEPAPERVEKALPADLQFANHLGGFADEGREYAIRTTQASATPAPWCNVIANPQLGCLVSESSLGATWCVNAGENRLSPWRNDPTTDAPSEALYLRDEETAEVWSATPLPASMDAVFHVRHGAGYSTFEHENHAFEHTLTVFVPPDSPVKILRLRVKNLAARPRRLTVTHFVEWLLAATRADNRSSVLCEVEKDASCILARSPFSAQFRERVAFMTCDRSIHGFTCDRTEFLGRGGDHALPDALTRWGLSSTTEPGTDPCGALVTHLDVPASEETTVYFVLGQGKDREEALALARRYREPAAADAAFNDAKAHWQELLTAVTVKTPDPAMDVMLNQWLLYQSLSSRFFARAAYYQSSGAFGFRDQLQDAMAYLNAAPEICRAHILLSAAHQFEEGDVLHWWHPPGDAGVRTRCSDDYLWLPFVTAFYVESTGDVGIMEERVTFLRARPLEHDEGDRYAQFPNAPGNETLMEHCRRALMRGFTQGPHGLPLIGSGDWNDGMSRVGKDGKGESVWLAWFLIAVTEAYIRLAQRVRPSEDVEPLRVKIDKLRKATEACAWDGAWYLRGFYDDGTPLGTKTGRTCRIDSIAQSWAVLSGVAEQTRAEQAMRSAETYLVEEEARLVLLLTPPFSEGIQDAGYIQAYPEGVRENGGQYTHAATWLGFAHAKQGDGAAAARILSLLNPIHHAETAAMVERYRIEPYALAGDVYNTKNAIGQGGWSWYTGAASWAYRLGVEQILGLARVDGGIRIDPCIPPTWPGFEATVRLGKQTLHIVVENPEHVSRKVKSITIDGQTFEGTVISPSKDGSTARREVRVVLGAESPSIEPPSGPAPVARHSQVESVEGGSR